MTDKAKDEQITMLRDALKQFQYAAHEILYVQTDKLKLAVKLGDLALAATAPSTSKRFYIGPVVCQCDGRACGTDNEWCERCPNKIPDPPPGPKPRNGRY